MTADRPTTEPRTAYAIVRQALRMTGMTDAQADARISALLAEAAQGAEPLDMSCDRIVNNGMGEPTECGRSYPCDLHDEVAAPRAEGLDVRRQVIVEARPYFEKVADTMDRSEAKPGARFADLLRDAWREMFDAVIEGPERAARLSRPSDERIPESEEPR